MAQVQFEKMSYRFDVITSYEGNTYILSKVQQAIADARKDVEDGNAVVLNNAGKIDTLSATTTYMGHWSVKRHDVNVDID